MVLPRVDFPANLSLVCVSPPPGGRPLSVRPAQVSTQVLCRAAGGHHYGRGLCVTAHVTFKLLGARLQSACSGVEQVLESDVLFLVISVKS